MFARTLRVSKTAAPAYNVAKRTMVTETALKIRLATVANVEKITKTMKMVAAAKLRGSQRTLDVARVFSKDVVEVWPDQDIDEGAAVDNLLFVAICSDAGLCGAVNSTIVRAIRNEALDMDKKKVSYEMLLYGNKASKGLERQFKPNFNTLFTESGKLKTLTFRQVCMLVEPLNEIEYTQARVYYQYFRSMLSYDTTIANFYPMKTAIGDGKFLYPYEIEGDNETLENFYQFRTAVRIFHFMSETSTSMLSSRMTAMENSSKNAGEMLEALTLQLNRSRQARITTELIEIISGASAAEEQASKS